ncbi:unnamed protein product [Aureobasidium uvarum]|uniref:Uncharacterized protein n=1 Tax=Aureobasidium uvarum TaxID=2773716 RepID=A0A9N8KM18_9PEZI|nr:unnamed protein product [Aureobasidium uvarum]
MATFKQLVTTSSQQDCTSSNIHDLVWSFSSAAYLSSDLPQNHLPIVTTFWDAKGDKQQLQSFGFDFDKYIWRSFDIQPMIKHQRPRGKVASKGPTGQYKLIEAFEEFGRGMTTQKRLLERYPDGMARLDNDDVQHCAVTDATSTVKLTGELLEDIAQVDEVRSIEEGTPPKTAWPTNGPNIRILSLDTCCLPEDTHRPRGYKYPTFMSELGIAFIDTDTIRAHPEDWHEFITKGHAIIAEHWNHHPHRRCQDSMGIDNTLPVYPRFSAACGPSGCLQEERTFVVDGTSHTVTMSPDSEIVPQAQLLDWLTAKIPQ